MASAGSNAQSVLTASVCGSLRTRAGGGRGMTVSARLGHCQGVSCFDSFPSIIQKLGFSLCPTRDFRYKRRYHAPQQNLGCLPPPPRSPPRPGHGWPWLQVCSWGTLGWPICLHTCLSVTRRKPQDTGRWTKTPKSCEVGGWCAHKHKVQEYRVLAGTAPLRLAVMGARSCKSKGAWRSATCARSGGGDKRATRSTPSHVFVVTTPGRKVK